jgi:hypothetical protein
MTMDDTYIEPNWQDPASLRHCAERLKMQAAKMAVEMSKYRRFAPEPNKNPFVDIVRDYTPEDPAVTAERETFFRTQQAKRQILAALAAEERQAAQQREEARTAFSNSAIGKLFGRQ